MINKLRKFVGDVALIDVFLKTQNASSNVLPRTIDPAKIGLNFDFKARYERIENEKIFISYQSLQVRADRIKSDKGKDQKDKTIDFDITVEYALVYTYENFNEDMTDDLLLEFCRTTGFFNAYPYLRESIHSLTCKMGIPPVVAPLLKIEPPKDSNKQEAVKTIEKQVRKKKAKAL